MTIVGKVLIFFVLVFCLVAGGLMIAVYSTSRNYQKAYTEATDTITAVQADRDQYRTETERLQAELAQAKLMAQQQVEDEKKKTAQANKKAADAEALNGTLRQQLATVQGTGGGLQEVNKSRADEVKALTDQVAALNTKIREQADVVDDERDQRVHAEIERKTYQDRNRDLEAELKEMARELARSKNAGTTGVVGAAKKPQGNPPPDNAEGRIRAIDQGGNLLTISIGSDAGLAEGHTLQVFRLGQSPKYLGTVEILSVRPHEAVARPTKKGLGLQVDDRVATKIQIGGGS